MTLSVLALLVAFSLAARWSGRRFLARGLGIFTGLLFLAAACGPLPAWLLAHLQDDYVTPPVIRWMPRNTIVLLTAGTTRVSGDDSLLPTTYANARIIRTVELYLGCRSTGRQCRVLISGGDSQKHGAAESLVYAAVLRQLGVPGQAIEAETLSMNTYENARYSRGLLLIDEPQTLVLVTSGIHMQRSLLDFGHFDMHPLPVASDDIVAAFSWLPQASNLQLCDMALHEYIGIAQFHLYNALGLNSMPVLGPPIPDGHASANGGVG